MTKEGYQRYLESPWWRRIRADAIIRSDHHCQMCGAENVELSVHHNSYDRLGEERPSDLIVLCRRCHSIFHINGDLAETADWLARHINTVPDVETKRHLGKILRILTLVRSTHPT